VACLTPRLLFHRGKIPVIYCTAGYGAELDALENRQLLLLLPGIESRFHWSPARSMLIMPTASCDSLVAAIVLAVLVLLVELVVVVVVVVVVLANFKFWMNLVSKQGRPFDCALISLLISNRGQVYCFEWRNTGDRTVNWQSLSRTVEDNLRLFPYDN